MALSEIRNGCPAGYRVALSGLLALLFSTMLAAQDDAATGQGQSSDAGEPVVNAVERVFIQSGSGEGALAQRFPHLAVWLEPEDAPRVLAMVERESAGKANGAIIVIGDEGDSANAPLLAAMRQRLAESGWATMTLGLASPSQALQQARNYHARVQGGEGSGQPPSDEPVMIDVNSQAVADLLQGHRDTMNAMFTAAAGWFAERGYPEVVLVGVGRGAEAVHGYLPEAPASVRRAVWVVADFGRQANGAITEGMSGVRGLSVLDLYSSREAGALDRKAAFSRSQSGGYQAMPLPADPQLRPIMAGAVVNRLLGWLSPQS